jgi:hypothetical protein
MSWTTPAEVLEFTGSTVNQSELNQAYHIIVLFTGATTDAEANLKPKDLLRLKMAEAYQAAWMLRRVDFYGQRDVDHQIQDELQYDKGDEDMHVLAPLAKNALRRLSWMKTRNLEPLTADQALVLRGKLYPETWGLLQQISHDDEDLFGGFRAWRPL